LLYPPAERIEGMILWNGNPSGIVAPPGAYFARFKIGKDSAEVPFTIKADPNYKTTQADYDQQHLFLQTVMAKFNETQTAIKDIRALRAQINDFVSRQGKDIPKDVKSTADSINKKLTGIEETLYQTKAKSGQDVLNYPIKLNDKLSGVFDAANSGNFAPSRQVREVYAELSGSIDKELARLKQIKEKDILQFNELIRQKTLPLIGLKQ
jgi:ABC-type transporter Mla subunit MlaD